MRPGLPLHKISRLLDHQGLSGRPWGWSNAAEHVIVYLKPQSGQFPESNVHLLQLAHPFVSLTNGTHFNSCCCAQVVTSE